MKKQLKQSKAAKLTAQLNGNTSLAAMSCQQCQNRKEATLHNVYNPLCLKCGADGATGIRRFGRPKEEENRRLREWLESYVSYGHNELELRELAKRISV